MRGSTRGQSVILTSASVFLAWSMILSVGTALGGHGKEDDVDTVTVEQVKFLLDAGEKLFLVDLRPSKDYAQKRLPGARSIPMAELNNRLGEIPKAGRVILYCDCPPADEAQAYFLLRDNGHRNVSVLGQGFSRWLKQKYPTETGRP